MKATLGVCFKCKLDAANNRTNVCFSCLGRLNAMSLHDEAEAFRKKQNATYMMMTQRPNFDRRFA